MSWDWKSEKNRNKKSDQRSPSLDVPVLRRRQKQASSDAATTAKKKKGRWNFSRITTIIIIKGSTQTGLWMGTREKKKKETKGVCCCVCVFFFCRFFLLFLIDMCYWVLVAQHMQRGEEKKSQLQRAFHQPKVINKKRKHKARNSKEKEKKKKKLLFRKAYKVRFARNKESTGMRDPSRQIYTYMYIYIYYNNKLRFRVRNWEFLFSSITAKLENRFFPWVSLSKLFAYSFFPFFLILFLFFPRVNQTCCAIVMSRGWLYCLRERSKKKKKEVLFCRLQYHPARIW